jgi:hypothetical protein
MSATSSPTPTDLRHDPELAIVAALDHTLRLAVAALVAIYPELSDSQRPLWRVEASASGEAASALVARSEALGQAISAYRAALLRARETELTDELPF